MDHDQRFKAMIREFFPDFMRLFFPEWASCFDFTSTEWLDKEVLPNPPDGDRHLLDLVAKLRTLTPVAESTSEEWLAVVHIEIESQDRTTALKPRLPRYYMHLRERQELPVLPIVLYLRVGLDGIGVDTVEEYIGPFNVLTFRYLYVGLPALDALQYAQGDNWLGVGFSALMSAPRDQWPEIGRTAVQRLSGAVMTEFQRFLLYDCIQAYLPLDEQGRQELERLMMTEPFTKIVARNKTHYDLGLEQGREQGIEQGMEKALRDVATALLENRFQSLPESIIAKMAVMNAVQLRELAIRVPNAGSIAELFPE